ncbi:MAG: adenylate/guanylate cyclase domain-containing protein [Deltaproteobacteria bacterium]|nr:adenylate/guanylate cyclase domain-containing protein [Deltaproteobacteria bacterium]
MPIVDVVPPPISSLRLGHAARFLLQDGGTFADPGPLITGLAEALILDGVVVERFSLVLAALHPQVAAVSVTWKKQSGAVVVEPRGWGGLTSQLFLRSPIARFYERTHDVIRRKLCDPACATDFEIVADLRSQGATDYLALHLGNYAQRLNVISCTTHQPGGFTDEQLHTLLSIQPILAVVVQAHVAQRISSTLLQTYLGKDAGERVLAGQVQRGQGEAIPALISFCDLRDFTGLSDRLPREALLAVLDDTFDAVVTAVSDHGGEVLKFMGDSVLTIFRAPAGEEAATCARARAASAEIFRRVEEKNRSRGDDVDRPRIRVALSLHLGDVHYGNIGGPSRLDFTVVGPAVNLASRLQGLCGQLGRPALVSAAVAAHLPGFCDDLGLHVIRGLAEPVRVHGLDVGL